MRCAGAVPSNRSDLTSFRSTIVSEGDAAICVSRKHREKPTQQSTMPRAQGCQTRATERRDVLSCGERQPKNGIDVKGMMCATGKYLLGAFFLVWRCTCGN